MNIVFWFLVILLLGLVWWICVPGFQSVGKFLKDEYDNAKENMSDDSDERKEEDNIEKW